MKWLSSKWVDYVILTIALFLIAHTLDAVHYNDISSYSQYGESAGTGTLSKQIGFLLLFVYGVAACLTNRKRVFTMSTLSGFLTTAFFVTITLSIAWSVDRNVSVARWFGFATYVLAGLGATKRLGGEGLLRWYVVAQSSYLAAGLINELVTGAFHPFTSQYRFAGIDHPNATGNDAAVLAFASIALWRKFPTSRVYRSTLGIAFVFLFLTRSRTALLGAVIALIIVYGVVSLRGLKLGVYLYGLVLLVSVPIILLALNVGAVRETLSLGRSEANPDALTGRGPLWSQLYDEDVSKRPLLGYGYGAFWTPERIEDISSAQNWAIAAAHSTYLDAVLAVGFLGALLYVGAMLSLLGSALRLARRGQQEGFFIACLLCASLFDSFTESDSWYVSSIYLFLSIQATFIISSLTLKARQSVTPEAAFSAPGLLQPTPLGTSS